MWGGPRRGVDYLRRARATDVTWPLPKDLGDATPELAIPGTGGNQRASVGAGLGRDAS